MTDDVLAYVEASTPRRVAGVLMLVILGGLLLWLARPPAGLGLRAALTLLGAGAFFLAWRLYQATAKRLELTATCLRDSAGDVVAEVANIAKVERGTFAFKPSNGFLIRLKEPGSRRWLPGLWWRVGRRAAVGGVTAGHQTKAMAEIMQMMLAESDRQG